MKNYFLDLAKEKEKKNTRAETLHTQNLGKIDDAVCFCNKIFKHFIKSVYKH
jgi:hypothetical protein